MESSTVTAAVGVWFYCKNTDRLLYLMRSGHKHGMTWGLPGGKSRDGETLRETISRECHEEMQYRSSFDGISPIEKFTSPDARFVYHTFFYCVDEEFVPVLNNEHWGYAWIKQGVWPKPMHPGLWSTVNLTEVMDKIALLTDQTSQ